MAASRLLAVNDVITSSYFTSYLSHIVVQCFGKGDEENQVSLDSYTNHEVFCVHSFQMVIGGGEGKLFLNHHWNTFKHMKWFIIFVIHITFVIQR